MLERIGDTVEMAHGRMSEVMSATEAQATSSARAVLTIRTMAHMVGQIEGATRQQADGSARISEAVEAMEARIREVAASGSEQLEDAGRVLAAMADIVKISGENRSTAADIAGITRVLHHRAEELRTITGKFRT
jgi:methyl-accepting chemotaxis protein